MIDPVKKMLLVFLEIVLFIPLILLSMFIASMSALVAADQWSKDNPWE